MILNLDNYYCKECDERVYFDDTEHTWGCSCFAAFEFDFDIGLIDIPKIWVDKKIAIVK